MALEADWKKSSYSSNGGQNCVEARKRQAEEGTGLAVQLRDSQLSDASPVITVTPRTFRVLLASIKQAQAL